MEIRDARPGDAKALCAVINPHIAAGGSTAHRRPFDAAWMLEHYVAPPQIVCCTVAEEAGRVLGFQSLVLADDPDDPLPEGWAVIASFVAEGQGGRGIGRAMFEHTGAAARAAGVTAIDATIRADNAAGLRYYAGLGFTDWDRLVGVPLGDGRPVDRIRKKFVF
ncbi:GNAT family N-acetyltransferase [Limimaricola pyoseonensis]|uniref:L-amino acid N-acyltransferase YncA n=1 Tax=Limimaricola pyoseonensis TaxID=521013 RepID=A0A1G7BWS2_9RHOB|nr:GNAT family N-acetyltransferase [Limimaricola pyoseonensis]SDE31507.1 L-amino acid N-acyltransferase YncA [Limimaricola pyoseonensis]